jgi:hypothetical protein
MKVWYALLIGFCAILPVKAFQETVTHEEVVFQKKGEGVLKYRGLIKVYQAALYLSADDGGKSALTDIPRYLEVKYLVDTKQSRFDAAGLDVLKKAYGEEACVAIKERLDLLNSWYDEPRKGERCAILYVPGKGTRLSVNGEVRGWIPGKDFGEMYFSIWLGDPCASDALRKDLLNEK